MDKITTVIRAGIKAIGISNQINPVVYFGGTSAQLYKIEKAGTTASGKEVNFNNYVPSAITNDNIKGLTLHPNNPYILYVALSNINTQPRVWKVTGLDSVTNKPVFTNISGDLPPGLPVNMMEVDPKNPDRIFFAGTDFGLYYSTDSGKTWIKEYRIPNVAIHELKMRADGQLFAFTHGRGMFTLKIKETPSNKITKPQANRATIEVYPQPANDFLEIKGLSNNVSSANMNVNHQGFTYTILDVQGRTIQSNAIPPNQRIPTSTISAGMYLLQIKNRENQSVFTKRILISSTR